MKILSILPVNFAPNPKIHMIHVPPTPPHVVLIHGAFIGFQLCFLRHRLVILVTACGTEKAAQVMFVAL